MKTKINNIEIEGARVHNLKNINLSIPRDKLVVITGLSGSGKSSLAFDTIYAEGQRRYLETFSAYVRQFLGNMERPDVDKIDGLSPVIAIEQKTTSKNPRSTVGTVTELYDFIRLLYARIGTAYSYVTGKKMISYTDSQIIELIKENYDSKEIIILSPKVKSRKGHYRELFETLIKQGFLRVRIDGFILDLKSGMKLDRYKNHDVELLIDRLVVRPNNDDFNNRLNNSIKIAMYNGDNSILILDVKENKTRYFSRELMCAESGISYSAPDPNAFSFNSPKGMCVDCKGIGFNYTVTRKKIIPNENVSIESGGIIPLGNKKNTWSYRQIDAISKKFNFSLSESINRIPKEALEIILLGGEEKFNISSKTLGLTRTYNIDYEGIEIFIKNSYNNAESRTIKRWALSFMDPVECKNCNGSRLKKESLNFKIINKNISSLTNMDLSDLYLWIENLSEKLSKKELIIGEEIIKEILVRLNFLLDVGLDYLQLNRTSKSLSGGESQRIRLATQIGSQLLGVLYILDEPSIGLHQKDNIKLINSLCSLRDLGNSIIVVEHDKEMILKADYLIDMGPFAGKNGGQIISSGKPKDVIKQNTLTSNYLNGKLTIPTPLKRRKGNGEFIKIQGCNGNNLKNIDVVFPLGLMIGVTGVSGSGKSTLINETLYPILNSIIYNGVKVPLEYSKISGVSGIDKIIDVNQSPIGRTPRSNPATYCGVFSEIRSLFSLTPESKIRGYKPGRFSFNVVGGRCESCQGGGMKTIEMNFLPDVYVECETCQGKRFNRETLEIRYKGKSINDVLNMSINDACDFFELIPKIYRKIKMIMNVGLGYITLGQSSTTLSGGEAQRVKLSSELSKKDTGKTFYILDEPTTGLHFEDIRVLLEVLNILVDKGNTVLIIEHNIEVIKQVDHIIDVGLKGGKYGGEIICVGTPEEVAGNPNSFTAPFLFKELNLDN
jgi:excinuclease ABC subunit A